MFGEKSNGHVSGSKEQLIMFAASPGTIAMIITLASDTGEKYISVNLILSITIAVVLTLIIMLLRVSLRTNNVRQSAGYTTKFMGLIVAGMGLQFALDGINDFFM